MSIYGVFSGSYFPSFGLNTERYSVFTPNAGNYGPEKTPYLDTLHAVAVENVFFSKIWASLIYFAVLYPAIFCWNETVVQLGSLWGDRVGWDAVSPPQWSPGAKSRKSLAILHPA